ncbi:uncharacterized protein LOC117174999 isoform X2 [Belonocnema kinseyi]|uniref:uncharacterized protein LOC117174999 isoform X2 n=1 Tax=Belonocnema kinseyi TaxID=2817044 RepID=UPI00143DEDA2|nr:uncharacterized protein LOC117174999 isoform X2 [Belonocnema kinseyi]
MNPNTLKQWLYRGEIEKLEHVVLEGRGSRLLGERSPDLRTRVFLKGLPNYLTKISQIHDAVVRGSLSECQKLLSEEPKKKLPLAKDSTGTPLIQKAVYYDHQDIVEWLTQQFPATVHQKDREGRTALHYCAACREPELIWDILIEADCDASICDKKGNPAAYYLEHHSEIELPETERMVSRKVISHKENLEFKPSNIRIWIHNRDIGKLQQVLWDGHGAKLRCETSNNPRVKRFLEAVPFIMGTIKEIHARAIKNDVEGFKRKIADPVSPIILCSKDINGHNALHKAAGLGNLEIAREILELYPDAVFAQANDGKTPLHYAAAAKDDGLMYNLLVEFGADEGKLDNKFKAPAFYKNRPTDVDMSTLTIIPDAPRVSGSYPKNWDWRILDTEDNVIREMRKSTSKIAEIAEIEGPFNIEDSPTKVKNGTHEGDLMKQTEPEEEEEEEKEGEDEDEDEEEKEGEDEEDPVSNSLIEDNSQAVENEEPEVNSPEKNSPVSIDDSENNEEENPVEDPNESPEENPEENPEESPEENSEETPEENTEERPEENPEENLEEKSEENPEENPEKNPEETNEDANQEEDDNNNVDEVKNAEQKERGDASTGDSGVDDALNEEVILGEHEALLESDFNDEGMETDTEVEKLTQNGNMEQLAELVLNGEGRRLVGRHSSNPELQSFIDNVPAYMGKIHAVHMAAREGNLRDLQSALDRRKFAIARDGSSPRGATPLHVAVIFGHTTIIRYLAGRFPETAHAMDLDGRTPLHYAATLADNGHYYNLLLHLGANPLIQDKLGQKAEYYKQNQNDLSHKKLLRSFGAHENLADEMLTDKGKDQSESSIFRVEEGRYLANSLGDPLIKGLTEVAKTRPEDPEANVLIIDEREEETNDNAEDDPGYPQSPDIDPMESNFNGTNRDEHGQCILHFAAVRSHSKDALYHLLQDAQLNVGFRDELYRTGRDIAEQANIQENIDEIDRWVVYLAARGETEKLVELLLEGYDHILDATDSGVNIVDVANQQGHEATVQFLQSIPNYMTRREELHRAIRAEDTELVKTLLEKNGGGAKLLCIGKNIYGRSALHIAVLKENEEIVEHIVHIFPETLRIGDNMDRTALHYAMALPSIEVLSNILIKAGAKRVKKDLKSRQPTYYYMNKSEIHQLQEEEIILSS